MAGEEVVGSWDKEGVFVFVLIFRIFCLVFVISSIPERDKQHFQGEKKNHVIRKQRRVRAPHFRVSLPRRAGSPRPLLFPVASIRLSFWWFPVILLSPFVLPA